MLVRIPDIKYGFIELNREEVRDPLIDGDIKLAKALIEKYAASDSSLEVVMSKKECPKCKKRLLEKIGISEKNNKPYHRIKCEDESCGYISWIDVASK